MHDQRNKEMQNAKRKSRAEKDNRARTGWTDGEGRGVIDHKLGRATAVIQHKLDCDASPKGQSITFVPIYP